MKKHLLALVLLLGLAPAAHAGFQVGANVNVFDFFYLPKNSSGVTTSANFGLGSVYGGYSLSDVFAVRVVLGSDNTGTLTASGQDLFGQPLNASGKFKVFLTSAEIFLAPPFFPLYIKAGAGIGKLSTDLPAPFDGLKMKAAFYGGLGITFGVSKFKISGGLDLVYVSVDPGSTGLDLSGFPYFRTVVGVTYSL